MALTICAVLPLCSCCLSALLSCPDFDNFDFEAGKVIFCQRTNSSILHCVGRRIAFGGSQPSTCGILTYSFAFLCHSERAKAEVSRPRIDGVLDLLKWLRAFKLSRTVRADSIVSLM